MASAHRALSVLAALALLALLASHPAAAPVFSDWAAPVNLGPVVNSTSFDGGPGISKDGLSLYFHSNRPGGFGDMDIWVAQRPTVDAPWGTPVNLGSAINTNFADAVPTFSRDGHWMFFTSTRPAGFGSNDIWASWRAHVHDDFGWQPPFNLGANINAASFDAGPTFFENDDVGVPLLFFTSNRPGGLGTNDVYASELQPDGFFGAPVHISELSSSDDDARLTIRHDGLEIILFSNRPGGVGLYDLWFSTRETVFSTWATPENVGAPVNTAFQEFQPALSADRETLLFTSNRPGGVGGLDLYATTRVKVRP